MEVAPRRSSALPSITVSRSGRPDTRSPKIKLGPRLSGSLATSSASLGVGLSFNPLPDSAVAGAAGTAWACAVPATVIPSVAQNTASLETAIATGERIKGDGDARRIVYVR